LPVPVEQYPDEAEPSQSERKQRRDKSDRRSSPANRLAVRRAELQAPGAHPQRLPAVSPEPAEKKKAHQDQISGVDIVARSERLPAIERQQKRGRDEQHSAQEKGIVGERREAAETSRSIPGDRSIRGLRRHDGT
jgi:hypothetical protein